MIKDSLQYCPYCFQILPKEENLLECPYCNKNLSGLQPSLPEEFLEEIFLEYLPRSLVNKLLESPESITFEETIKTVGFTADLLNLISMYLPRLIINRLQGLKTVNDTNDSILGTMMFADISGFTAMSEQLSHIGKQGAEEVKQVVNSYFTETVDTILHFGGDLLKFDGDATLSFFPAEHIEGYNLPYPIHIIRAILAAIELQDIMKNFEHIHTSKGIFKLSISIGISTGYIKLYELGNPEIGIEQIYIGESIHQCILGEVIANAGEICLYQSSYEEIKKTFPAFQIEDNYWILIKSKHNIDTNILQIPTPLIFHSKGSVIDKIIYNILQIETLKHYLPISLFEKLKANPEKLEVEGEHRLVTIMFISFWGLDYDSPDIEKILNDYLNIVREIVIKKYDGIINKIDCDTFGERLMILFGAPFTHENDEERAILSASEIQNKVKELNDTHNYNIKQKIGINTGFVFAGNVGSTLRKEYSVMGDEVNLASRILSYAKENQILINESTYNKINENFLFNKLKAITVKGKATPIQLYEFKEITETLKTNLLQTWLIMDKIIGRDNEKQIILDAIRKVKNGQRQIMSIYGDSGIGKSRLIQELLQRSVDAEILGIVTNCKSYGTNIPYLPWINLLKIYFNIFGDFNSLELNPEIITNKIKETFPEWIEYAPLLGNMLGLKMEETPTLSVLPALTKKDRLFSLILRLLRVEMVDTPLFIVIEDCQWMDGRSFDLLLYIVQNTRDLPLILALSHRLSAFTLWQDEIGYIPIALKELNKENTTQMVLSILDIKDKAMLPNGLTEMLYKKSQGNPLFIREVIKSLLDVGILIKKEGSLKITRDINSVEIPDTINGVIMSRIDQLDESSRNILQIASVIGEQFQAKALLNLTPLNIDVVSCLNILNNTDFITTHTIEPELSYIFKQSIIQEVVYETLLYSRRQELHKKLGEYLEEEAIKNDNLNEKYELLAYNYQRGEVWDKAIDYLIQAGDKAKRLFAYNESLRNYNKALKILSKIDNIETLQLSNRIEKHTLKYIDDKISPECKKEVIFQALKSSSELTRKLAIKILNEIYYENKIEVISEMLKDESADVRIAAISVLGNITTKGHFECLQLLANDKNPNVRLAIIKAMGGKLITYFKNLSENNLSYKFLINSLEDPNTKIQAAASLVLWKLQNPIGLSKLHNMLESNDLRIKLEAIQSYGETGKTGEKGEKQFIDILLPYLEDFDENIRIASAKALITIGDPRGLNVLFLYLHQKDIIMERDLFAKIVNIGPNAQYYLMKIMPLLKPELQATVIAILGKIMGKAVYNIISTYSKRNIDIAWKKILQVEYIKTLQLGNIGKVIIDTLEDEIERMKNMVVQVMTSILDRKIASLIIYGLKDTAKGRNNAIKILSRTVKGELAEEAQRVFMYPDTFDKNNIPYRTLEDLIDDLLLSTKQNNWLKACILYILRDLTNIKFLPLLKDSLKDKDPLIRENGLYALYKIRKQLEPEQLEEILILIEQFIIEETNPTILSIANSLLTYLKLDSIQGDIMEQFDVLSTMEKIFFLQRVPLFEEVPPEALYRIVEITKERVYSANTCLFKEGEYGEEMYLIIAGDVDILVDIDGINTQVAIRSIEDCLGEMALIDDAPRSATGRAISEVRTLVITKTKFLNILNSYPKAAKGILKVVLNRLRQATWKQIKQIKDK